MKGIRILLPIILAFVLTLGSCDNSLWYGGNKGEADFTLRLELPYPEQSPGTAGRALALQGLHIFIEIADIQDVPAYTDPNGDESTDDSLFYEIPDGDGNWISTPWGGHAVFHAQAYGTEAITVEFNNVPTNRDLLIRVIQAKDRGSIESDILMYGEVYSFLSQTYYSDGNSAWMDMGIPLTTNQLSSGQLRIFLRPHVLSGPPIIQDLWADQWADPASFIETDLYYQPLYRPTPGNTQFTSITLDMSEVPIADPGMLVGYRIQMAEGSPIPGIVSLYDIKGEKIPPDVARTTTVDGETTIESFSIVKAPLDAGDRNTDFFIGSTIIPGVDLSDVSPPYIDFSLIAQVVGDGNHSMLPSNYNFHQINWDIPYDFLGLLKDTDLEYQVLYWLDIGGTEIGSIDVDDINDVLSKNPIVLVDWGSLATYKNPVIVPPPAYEYTIDNIFDLPTASQISPPPSSSLDAFFVAVLARIPGGEPFLIVSRQATYSFG